MTLVLKSLNRRKHNSQEWMFAFTREKSISVEDKSRVILFMTDCGTYFEKGCLLRLVANMLDNPKCVGCTGRQRVMPAALQDCEDEGLVEKYFRQIQCFDYEASYAYSSGTFSLIGMLPVLPGPCAMWRYSALIHHRSFRPIDPLENVLTGGPRKGFLDDDDTSVLNSDASFINHHIKGKEEISEEDSGDISFSGVSESVFKTPFAVSVDLIGSRPIQENSLEHFSTIISTPPQETNLVIENLKLAEDRIPSYAIVTHGEPGSYVVLLSAKR